MRKRILGIIAGGAVATAGAIAFFNAEERHYVPRNEGQQVNGAAGAWEYLAKMRANQVTGEIDNRDVFAALQALDQMKMSGKTAALGLTWDFAGPDNVGGRTRAFLIDRTNPNVLYAAGVAGGVFKSTNAALSWSLASNGLTNLSVVCLAQAANGDLYAGTGENMYAPTNAFGPATSPGMTGGGIYKSTDGGQSWTVLANTIPPSNVNSNGWSAVGDMGTDPTNANRIYAATAGGFRRSDDGGATWTNPIPGPLASGRSTDMDVSSDGAVWVNVGDRVLYSPNGNDNSFVEISKLVPGTTGLPRNSSRQAFTVSPQDNNVIYVVQLDGSALSGVYRTLDKGATWTKIGTKTNLFDPFCESQCQGNWDLLLEVNPLDKNHIFVGGIRLWEWKQADGWRRVDGGGPFYVHADKHRMRFNPNNSNIIYALTDGGVGKSSDGGLTWGVFNKNYTTAQYYHLGIGEGREIVGGTQDNGSHIVDGTGNTPLSGRDLGPVGNFSGDGGYNLISWLNNKVYFNSYQSGRMGRSENKGESYTPFWAPRMLTNCQPGSNMCTFSSWMIPYHLYETTNDPLSADSVWFIARTAISSLGFGGGEISFSSTLNKPQPAAQFVTNSFKITSGSLLVTANSNGTLFGDGTGTFDPATGAYSVTFNSVPLAEIVVTCDVSYSAGAKLKINSNTNALPFNYTLPVALSPGDSLHIQDPVQSVFAVGLNGSLWMTRYSLDFSSTPEWYKVAQFSGVTQCVTVSADGNYIWAGTENGRLIRVSNVDQARSIRTGDIDSASALVDYDIVATFGSRNITGVSVDPNNPNRVVVTLGNYGNTQYVYYSNNATSATPTFAPVQGNLPAFPVYCATFNKLNSAEVIIGTEYGVFTTDNINASTVTWTEENAGMARVPVFAIVQYRTDKSSTPDETIEEGDIFIGTHARGFFRSSSLMTSRPIGVAEEEIKVNLKANGLQLFPNPANEFSTLSLDLAQSNSVNIFVRDMNGRLVNQIKFSRLPAGQRDIRIETSDLPNGTYLVSAQIGTTVTSGKLIVQR